MEKRKVLAAYRRGFLTLEECAQIIGVDNQQMDRLLKDSTIFMDREEETYHQSAVH